MWFSFLVLLPKAALSDDQCVQWNNSCEECLGLGKETNCGWCRSTKECFVANAEGTAPLNNTCSDWTIKFDMTCHLESQKPLPTGARIGLAVFAGIVAIATAVFWICLFPHFMQKKEPQEQEQEQDEDDE